MLPSRSSKTWSAYGTETSFTSTPAAVARSANSWAPPVGTRWSVAPSSSSVGGADGVTWVADATAAYRSGTSTGDPPRYAVAKPFAVPPNATSSLSNTPAGSTAGYSADTAPTGGTSVPHDGRSVPAEAMYAA